MKKLLPCALLLLAVGCGPRLRDERNVTIQPGETKPVDVDPISSAQTVKVTATATTGQFSIAFCLAKDIDAVEKDMMAGKTSPKALGMQLKATQADISGLVPANEKATVLLMSTEGKKAEVKLKITN